MTAVQLVLLPFLVFVLPAMAAVAWWLRRRYTATIVHLQAGRRTSEGSTGDPWRADALGSPCASTRLPPSRVRIENPRDIVGTAGIAERASGPTRLRRLRAEIARPRWGSPAAERRATGDAQWVQFFRYTSIRNDARWR